MFRPLEALLAAATAFGLAGAPAAWADQDYGLGRAPTHQEIAGWDIDVRPDGQGLPPGGATAADGEEIYLERCAACHGEFGEGAGRYPVLIGGEGSLTSADPVKTLGSYWPYATTLFDYVNRAMPFGDAQSLAPDEVYALTAYLLYLNDLVEEDRELNQQNLAAIEMPNRDGFIEDPRPDTPLGEPCMRDCKAEVEILFKAKQLDVTPTRNGDLTE
jgi:cytochrome c